MGRCTGGTKSSAINSRKKKGWQTVSKEKARVAKKLAGTAQKHKAAVKAVSGKRTAKNQKKVERRQRLAAKEAEAAAAADVHMADSKQGKRKGKAGKAAAAAAAAVEAMQE